MFENLPSNKNTGGQDLPFKVADANEGVSQNNNFQNSPKPIEDIFSDSEVRDKPAIFRPKESPTIGDQFGESTGMPMDQYTGEAIMDKNKTIVFALMLISLMLVAMLGWYAYNRFFAVIAPAVVNTSPATQIARPDEDAKIPANNTPESVKNNMQAETKITELDSDNDGLSDKEELLLGTNTLLADTDGDGLFDREEVKVYKTNPLDMDTDKDGFSDGKEVKSGYNPNGSGKLYDIINK